MSAVHKALEALHPREWSELPSGDELGPFLQQTFSQAEQIVVSVPQPAGGESFEACRPHSSITRPNAARSAAEMHCSISRGPDPDIDDLAGLQKGWGKPVKINAKENPLGMTVWKMAGHDRHGAWFARRSVHEGLGFKKWKKAMQREFAQSLAVDGGPGEGSVRGIGADKQLEKERVEGVGTLDVYQLSAQFPGPVAPREFITCLLTSDTALSDISAVDVNGNKSIPRHYMVVSIPCDHPEAPQRSTPVRGNYESVELIREIPLNPAKSKSTPNLLNTAGDPKTSDAQSDKVDMREHKDDDPEMNPVEWIMITRSDPGGGIPRFMVERNTPASIAGDAVKFLDWATSLDEIPDADEDADKQAEVQAKRTERQASYDLSAVETNGHLAGLGASAVPIHSSQSITGAFEPSGPNDSGIIASLTGAVQHYTPDMIKDRLGMGGDGQDTEAFPAYEDDDLSSDTSYDSAYERTADWKTAYEGPDAPDPLASESSLSLAAGGSAENDEEFKQSSDHRHYEREIQKLAQRRKTLDEKMEKARQEEEKKKEEMASKEAKEQDKQRERIEKDRKKNEERFKKEMDKIEQKKKREEEKVEAKRRKARDKDANARDRRERDEYRRRVELLQRENELLRRQLGDLQRENTVLVQRVGKLSEGQNVMREVKEELERKPRSSSEIWDKVAERDRARSAESRKSLGASSKKSGETAKSKLSGMHSASEERVVS